jgi:hypothetical protein
MNAAHQHPVPERPFYLVMLPSGPVIWAAHFFTTYMMTGLWCRPGVGSSSSLASAQLIIAAITVAALLGIGSVGWSGYQRHAFGNEPAPHDEDSPEDRHRFLGLATMLLAGLSAVATIYVAVATWFFPAC